MSRARRLMQVAAAAAAALALVACSSSSAAPEDDTASDTAAGHYPVTIDNCGTSVTFDQAPQRIMLLESAPVTILDGIGAFDRVIARAGIFPPEYYPPELAAAVADVPSVTEDINAAGHLQISQEVIIAQEPDLVLGLPDGVSRQALADAGINVLVQGEYCADDSEPASFETLYAEVERYGLIFEREDQAGQVVGDLKSRVEQVRQERADQEERTAAVLYPTTAGGTMYAYGSGSMAQPQLEALGLSNVFAGKSQRVFEVQTEAIIAADPDVIILLYQGSEEGITETVTSLPGAEDIDAVANDQVITQLFNFTAPATPLTVDGLEHLADQLDGSE